MIESLWDSFQERLQKWLPSNRSKAAISSSRKNQTRIARIKENFNL
jgi:hypothetical protein